MKNTEISLAKSEDSEKIAVIERLCFSHPWTAENIAESMNFDTVFLVARVENTVAGYCGMQKAPPDGYITNVAVLPDLRRSGIGEKLLSALSKYAEKEKIEKISLEVRESNLPAQSLYKKCGYKRVGVRKNFYRDPKEDAYIYEVEISI